MKCNYEGEPCLIAQQIYNTDETGQLPSLDLTRTRTYLSFPSVTAFKKRVVTSLLVTLCLSTEHSFPFFIRLAWP